MIFYLLVVVQSLSCVRLFATPWTAAHQASLSFTISRSLLKLMSIESVMLSNRFILCYPLLLLPSVFPSISVFSSESSLLVRWPKYWPYFLRDCKLMIGNWSMKLKNKNFHQRFGYSEVQFIEERQDKTWFYSLVFRMNWFPHHFYLKGNEDVF